MALRIPVLQDTIPIEDRSSSLLSEGYWDPVDQLWRQKESRRPLVVADTCGQSPFGETTVSRTASEGVDQSEVSDALPSTWGETTITRTPGEGSDQSQI